LKELESASEALADANVLRGRDSILRDSNDQPLALGEANTNTIAHALGSAYLAYDYSPIEAAALGFARELKSYWLSSERPAAWDTFKDLHNNRAGRNVAEYARSNNLPRDQIQDLILDALSSGKLIVTQQDPRIDSSFNGNPANFFVPTGDGAPWKSPSKGFSDFARTVTRVPMASPNTPEGSMPRPADNGIGYPLTPIPPFAPLNYSTPAGDNSVERWIASLMGVDHQDLAQPALQPFNPYSGR
jgi:hypothetical protein